MPLRRIKVAANEKLCVPRVSESNENGRKCWDWSMRPLIVLACFIGVDFTELSKCGQKWKTAFSFIGLIIHAAFTVNAAIIFPGQLYQIANFYFGEGGNHSRTFLWNMIIDFLNFEVCCFGVHLILVLNLRKKWSSLSKAFQYPILLFDVELYDRLRRLSFFGVVYIIFGAVFLCVVGAISKIGVKTPFRIKLLAFSEAFWPFYPSFCIVLFGNVSYAASLAFRSISSKLNSSRDPRPCHLSKADLFLLKNYYVSVCNTIDVINDCFGWLLLFIVPHLFVATINGTFYWFGIAKETKSVSGVMFFFLHHVNIFVICIAADSVRFESEKVLKKLLRLEINSDNNLCRKQIHEWVLQIALTSPRISALGVFHVGKNIIPTMIGTTLSYYFILHQFHSSEEKP